MQYKYITCQLPSNGLIYDTKEVHLRAKTIFDIKTLLSNPAFQLRAEIETLQQCIDPKDNVDVYDLTNQDVVYLLYKLRSLSSDELKIKYKNQDYSINISDLDVKNLEKWETEFTLPDSGKMIELKYTPIRTLLTLDNQVDEFKALYPDYQGDILNTVALLNNIVAFDNLTDKTLILNALTELSFKDSLFIVQKIEDMAKTEYGVVEKITLKDSEGKDTTVPIIMTEEFFRPTL